MFDGVVFNAQEEIEALKKRIKELEDRPVQYVPYQVPLYPTYPMQHYYNPNNYTVAYTATCGNN